MRRGDETSVLVVDDESNLADIYTDFLEPEYQVRTATSGSEALQKCDKTVDVVFLDRRLQEMKVGEVLEGIWNRGLNVQVAMLTAVRPKRGIVEMPFDDYLVKPVDKVELLRTVETLAKRATYDDRSQEFFRLASKKAALEVANEEQTPEYKQSVARLREVRDIVDSTLADLMARDSFHEFLNSFDRKQPLPDEN